MLRLLLLLLCAHISIVRCAGEPVLPPGDYVVVSPSQSIIPYKNGSISVTVSEQQLEVLANGIQSIWSTRMQYFAPQVGTVEALVTLALVASIAPSGNLLLAVDECVQNDLETQFTADMCSFFTTSAGCVGNEFVYSLADLDGDFVNNTHIAIQGMCGITAVIVFGCLGEDVCAGPLPGFGPALPAGQYDLTGPAPSFSLPGGVTANPLLTLFSLLVDENNIQIGLELGLFANNPTPSSSNVTMFGYAFTAPSGQLLFAFSSCTVSGTLDTVCPAIVSACSVLSTVGQVNLQPSNATYNDTLLIFSKQFCGLQGATQALCTDAEPCELPINSGANSLGFTLGAPCLYFVGRTIVFDQSCVTTVITQNITNQYVTNQVVTNQNVTNQIVENQIVQVQNVTQQTVEVQYVTNQFVTEQTVVQQTVTVQNVTDQSVTNQYVTNQFVTNQNVDSLTVNALTLTVTTITMSMGFVAGYTSPPFDTCGATGSASFTVVLQRSGNFVSGWIRMVTFPSPAFTLSAPCKFFGYVSGTQVPAQYRPQNVVAMGEIFPFIQDQNGNGCWCWLQMFVDQNGNFFVMALKETTGDDCCVSGSAFGFDTGGIFVIQSSTYYTPAGNIIPFSYSMP